MFIITTLLYNSFDSQRTGSGPYWDGGGGGGGGGGEEDVIK